MCAKWSTGVKGWLTGVKRAKEVKSRRGDIRIVAKLSRLTYALPPSNTWVCNQNASRLTFYATVRYLGCNQEVATFRLQSRYCTVYSQVSLLG